MGIKLKRTEILEEERTYNFTFGEPDLYDLNRWIHDGNPANPEVTMEMVECVINDEINGTDEFEDEEIELYWVAPDGPRPYKASLYGTIWEWVDEAIWDVDYTVVTGRTIDLQTETVK